MGNYLNKFCLKSPIIIDFEGINAKINHLRPHQYLRAVFYLEQKTAKDELASKLVPSNRQSKSVWQSHLKDAANI